MASNLAIWLLEAFEYGCSDPEHGATKVVVISSLVGKFDGDGAFFTATTVTVNSYVR